MPMTDGPLNASQLFGLNTSITFGLNYVLISSIEARRWSSLFRDKIHCLMNESG